MCGKAENRLKVFNALCGQRTDLLQVRSQSIHENSLSISGLPNRLTGERAKSEWKTKSWELSSAFRRTAEQVTNRLCRSDVRESFAFSDRLALDSRLLRHYFTFQKESEYEDKSFFPDNVPVNCRTGAAKIVRGLCAGGWAQDVLRDPWERRAGGAASRRVHGDLGRLE